MALHKTSHLLVVVIVLAGALASSLNAKSGQMAKSGNDVVLESHGTLGKDVLKNGWLIDDADEEDDEVPHQKPRPARPSGRESPFDYDKYCLGRDAVAGRGGAAVGGTAQGGRGGDARAIRLCRAYGGAGGRARSGLRRDASGGKGGMADSTDT